LQTQQSQQFWLWQSPVRRSDRKVGDGAIRRSGDAKVIAQADADISIYGSSNVELSDQAYFNALAPMMVAA
jgi:hypothetical protein